jgi:hypothetical protein
MDRRYFARMTALGAPAALAGCGAKVDIPAAALAVIRKVPAASWPRLAAQRIWFGHQSVGGNILQGLEALLRAVPEIGLRIVEVRSPADLDRPGFGHSKNGRNEAPQTKITGFCDFVTALPAKPDIAFFKFCYVDFTAETDASGLFTSYRAAMDKLRPTCPATKFVHITAPLTVNQSGPKAWLKTVLRRPLAGAGENIVRNKFNRTLLRQYQGQEPVFDLASVESRDVFGDTTRFVADGTPYLSLCEAYSLDGGHLNLAGSQWVAAHLLAFLAELT